jgi:hypothetical protein
VLTPDAAVASSPTGFQLDVHVDQDGALNGEQLTDATMKSITLALPPGVTIDPPMGDGLETCSEGLVGFTGLTELATVPGVSSATFTPELPGSFGSNEALEPGVNFCPNASKIGEVTIHTPLLPGPLQGAVYLASQNANPFGSLIALYIVAEEPESGVLVKLAGQATLNQETGQVSMTFENMPQLALEELELHFFDGERTPLATPARCGVYTTTATFTPWSAQPGESPVTSSSTFDIASGPGGSPCPGASLPFNPSLTGGSTNVDAGGFSPLSLTVGREDGQQDLRSVELHLPPGLLGLLSQVPACPEGQANGGTCGQESEIGETTISAGEGSDPVNITGKVYLTEKYDGAPFGLSIVSPVRTGPLDLEHDTSNSGEQPACDCAVVRATLEVDPRTAALTIATDGAGGISSPYGIPRIIDGVPLEIKRLNITIERPGGAGFMVNPTTCEPEAITGTVTGSEGASATVSEPFQVTHCTTLAFKPKLTASTSGKTSITNGASLKMKLTFPTVTTGAEANIAKLTFDLPKHLPSRLSTLQRACRPSTFAANPANCPPQSKIGYADVHTPLLPVPLSGPAIFVSHGDEALPSLTIVLQGDGVTIDLVGDTHVKSGVSSTTFQALPDVPIGALELTLPEGPYSALAANGNLCSLRKTVTIRKRATVEIRGHRKTVLHDIKKTVASSLLMPSEFVAHNGAQIRQSTPISVTGCAKAKPAKKSKAKPAKKSNTNT